MIKNCRQCIFLFIFMMVSCRGNVSDQNLSPEPIISPVSTETIAKQKTVTIQGNQPDSITPTVTTPDETEPFKMVGTPGVTWSKEITETQPNRTPSPVMITPTHWLTKMNYMPELSGKLFVGKYDGEEYIALDFEKHQTIWYKFPANCRILSSSQRAICIVDAFTENSVTYVYDIELKMIDYQFEMKGGTWYLTSSEELLAYILSTESKRSIYAYDLESNKSIYIGNFEHREQLYYPQLSNSGNSLIGFDYQIPQLDNDDRWYFMQADSLIAEPILTADNIVATDSFAWAPDEASVALIGLYREEGSGADAGTLVCGSVAIIYDPILQSTIHSIKMPDMRCVTPFKMYSFYSDKYFWSPDSSKLALVLDQQDICVIDLSTKLSTCSLITNYYGTEIRFRGLAWSPDSKYLAFIFSDNEIQVFSLENGRMYNLANTKELSSFRIGDILVWGR